MDEAKIEYKVGKETVSPYIFGGYKRVYWRVSNDEVMWWMRPYNGWKEAYFVSSGYMYGGRHTPYGELDATKFVLFNMEEFTKLKNKCHTLAEMKDYIKKSDEEFNKCNYEIRKKRKAEEREKNWKELANN
jgi:hypothetical protein